MILPLHQVVAQRRWPTRGICFAGRPIRISDRIHRRLAVSDRFCGCLGRTDRQTTFDNLLAQPQLIRFGQRHQGPSMTGSDLSGTQLLLNRFRQVQQTQQIAYCRPTHAQPARQLVDRTTKFLQVAAEGLGLFERIKILPLQVLFHRRLIHLLIGVDPHLAGNEFQARLSSRLPTSLAGDQLVSVATIGPDQ